MIVVVTLVVFVVWLLFTGRDLDVQETVNPSSTFTPEQDDW